MINKLYGLVLSAACLIAGSAMADDTAETADILAGHSIHGEAFDEGPRQKAYLMEGMPKVAFPVSTEKPECQAFVNQGFGQLCGFWSFEAERSFRQAALIDPDCAMTYWGMAMANLSSPERARGLIDEAMKRKEKADKRERRLIEALSKYIDKPDEKKDEEKSKEEKDKEKEQRKKRSEQYARTLEDILFDHPDDTNTKALLVLQHWKNVRSGLKINSHLAMNALLHEVFDDQPMHPAHHFRIHLWDNRKAEKALDSAAKCGQTAPGIAHMWHMPGHIYSKLKRYHDAAWHQEASARVDHAHMMRDRVLPDQIHNFAHNNEWLCNNLMNVGRVHDAISLAKNMIELPRHPKYNTLDKRYGSGSFGRSRLMAAYEQFELWDRLIEACESGEIEPTKAEDKQERRLRLLALAYRAGGRDKAFDGIVEELETRLETKTKEAEPPPEEAEKTDEEKEDGEAEPELSDEEKAKLKKEKEEAEKKRKEAENRVKSLKKILAEIRVIQSLEAGDIETADEYMEDAKHMDKARLAMARFKAGQTDLTRKIAEELAKKDAVLPLARAAWLFELCEEPEEADKAFETLRERAATVDLDLPVFARLAPMAKRKGHPEDWRPPLEKPDDIGLRPDLDALGPFRWQPSRAPSWSLTDTLGSKRSLKDYEGQPVVLIFYLGFGCLHCVEQLQAFAPEARTFREAGIEIVGISTESQQELAEKSRDYAADGAPIPFPLLANDRLDVFKSYRAYDDFEQAPLHGTFLIDRTGDIRWQDISYEPFTNVTFVVEEAGRLLGKPKSN